MTDYRFYKYRKINNHLLDSLENSTTYFAHQRELNDPFDCELDIVKAINNAAGTSSGNAAEWLKGLLKSGDLFERFQANINTLGICSFAVEPNEFETLMWSHYTENHKGVRILYEMPEVFLKDEDNILGVSKVTYETDALTDWFKSLAMELPVSKKKLITGLLIRVLTAKSPPWSYENEVRIIRPDSGIFKLDKSFIKQIFFGLNSTDEDIDKVVFAVKGYGSNIDLYRAIRGQSDFGIEYQEILQSD